MRFIDLLLVFIPITLILGFFVTQDPLILFVSSVLAIVPLAAKMGEATEELGKHYGGHIGGLLNATFGNSAELIIALIAINSGLIDLVKASLTGAIIGNLLFVLGFSMLVAGFKYKEQKVSQSLAGMNSTMLLIAFMCIMIPSVFHLFPGHTLTKEYNFSIIVSILLLLVYVASLGFSLITHKHLFMAEHKKEKPKWSKRKAMSMLALATIALVLMSEVLVGQVEQVAKNFGLSEIFIGAVIIAIIGNAAEHLAAIFFALKNDIDVAINITVGSSLQIAMFVAPVCVLVGELLMNQPMDLVFTPLEIIAVFSSVLIVNEISNDGKFNWFEGLQLIVMYAIIAALFFFI
ncbi:MAG: calcium/proton exchanger [Candidatus Micrarchaeota archaeon]